MLVNKISRVELNISLFIWISVVSYAIYCFYDKSNEFFSNHQIYHEYVEPGWPFLSRNKDISDSEWQLIGYLIRKLYSYIFLNIIISQICCKYNLFQVLKIFQVLLSTIVIINELGITLYFIFLFQPITYYFVIKLFRTPLHIWLCSGSFYYVLKYIPWDYTKTAYITIIGMYWMNLRCICYSIDCCNRIIQPNLLNFLSYCFYLPVLLTGPFISYKSFEKCFTGFASLSSRLKTLIINLIRYLFWYIFGEFIQHFIHVYATTFYPEMVEQFGLFTLSGFVYCMGQLFQIKYVVFYGISTSLAKFENIEVPSTPVCIGAVHLYSDMWRYFDEGLYNFLKTYIYIPLNKYIRNRIISTIAIFTFIYIWHGTEIYVLYWSVLNCVNTLIEVASKNIYNNFNKTYQIEKKIGYLWVRRIQCMLSTTLLVSSIIGNSFFLGRQRVGEIYVEHFLFKETWRNRIVLFLFLYNCCQVSTELRMVRKNRKKHSN